MNWTKLIPGYIEVRSLYWVRYMNRMEKDLITISLLIDRDQYSAADRRIKKFQETYSQTGPSYVGEKYAEIHRLEAMLNFLYSGSA